MIIWTLILTCVLAAMLLILEKKNLKSKTKEIRHKAWAVLIIAIVVQGLQLKTALIQESDSNALNDSLVLLNAKYSLIGGKIDNLLNVHKQDSVTLGQLADTITYTNALIRKSNLTYKNGKLVPNVVNSQFNLPKPVFNAPVQLGNGNTQNN